MAIKCPNCGSTHMALIAHTDAYFDVDEDGQMGDVILDRDGVACINETVELSVAESDDVEFKCRRCKGSFKAKHLGDFIFEVGEAL